MSKGICNICKKNRAKYCSYPEIICKQCCPNLTVKKVLEIMDITYHEAISSISYITVNENTIKLNTNQPIFWCTMNNAGLFQRCGVNHNTDTLIIDNLNYTENEVVLIEAYWTKEQGLRDMKKLKQNFRRIRSGNPYMKY
jgi:hypothetical protein